ncbi:MAG: toxin-antitoxin system protein [Veillonella sp.]|nr:toxin-antitoxin system protein [Veillonella sp.]
MRLIYARYNSNCNSIDITTFDNILLRIEWNKAEEGTRTTPGSQCALNALAIDEPLEYARLALDGEMQMWVDAEDSLELGNNKLQIILLWRNNL